MRTRTANPFNEAHNQPLRCIEWVAPPIATPGDVLTALAAIPGLIPTATAGLQNAYVNTSRRPDGSLYVAVCLYDNACNDPSCPGGHWPTAIAVAPVVTVAQRTALRTAVGEHTTVLTGTPADDVALAALGFGRNDGPRR